jgi:Peptidase S24-like
MNVIEATGVAYEENCSEFSNRVLTILKEQKRSKAWLSQQVGISPQALNYLLNHSTKPKFVNEIAFALEVSPEWLKTGKTSFVNFSSFQAGGRHIALLAMDTIGKSPHQDPEPLEVITIDPSYPSSCFAVKFENTSMEPIFNQGSILIFDSVKRPRNADFIIFSVNETGQVFFRQYFTDGDDVYLKSVDIMYKNFRNEKITIHGVLIESRNQFK